MTDLPTSVYNSTTMSEERITSFTSNVAVSVIIGILLIVGTAGNILTIIVILTNKHLQTVSNSFIFSLCVSDLISAIVCSPLWLYRRTWGFDQWKIGLFLCQFYWASDFATSYVTSLHILSFAGLRFIAIKRPFLVAKIQKRIAWMYVCCLWLLAIVAAIPMTMFVGVCNKTDGRFGRSWPSCSILENPESTCCVEQYLIYMATVSTIFFYLPEILVIVFSICIAYSLDQRRRWRQKCNCPVTTPCNSPKPKGQVNAVFSWSANLPDVIAEATSSQAAHQEGAPCDQTISPAGRPYAVKKNKKNVACPKPSTSNETNYSNMQKAFIQLTLIVIAFLVGYVPTTVYLLWTTRTLKDDKSAALADYWFGVASYICLRFSECMNPLLYNLGSTNLRRASKRLMRRLFNGKEQPHVTVH